MKLQEKEWFATRRPDIAAAPNAAARRRLIAGLRTEDPALWAAWLDASREAEGESHLVRNSGRYPLCGRGDINTYSIFAETKRLILSPTGRVGCIVPTGIATDDTTKLFFGDLVDSRTLVSLHGFENEEFIFPGVHHATKFCLLTMAGRRSPHPEAHFVFFARQASDLADDQRRFTLSPADTALLNPNTKTCPIFRSKRDAELTKAIYRRVPVLVREGPPEEDSWGIQFGTMFHMANDSGLFRTREQLERDGWGLDGNVFRRGTETHLPLYEAKMIHQFDHRFGTYEGQTEAQANQGKLPELDESAHADPTVVAQPRYWVPAAEVDDRLTGKWARPWLLGWRNVCRATDERTVIGSILPRAGVGHSMPLMFPHSVPVTHTACLLANLNAFVLDYSARQKLGGINLTYGYVHQLPVLPPDTYTNPAPWAPELTMEAWLLPRVLELVYTARDLAPFARDCGYDGPPFRWDDDRRFHLRCELDAAFFHLYDIARDDVAYVMDSFPIVKRTDEAHHGDYRTKRVILEIYDALGDLAHAGPPRCGPGGA